MATIAAVKLYFAVGVLGQAVLAAAPSPHFSVRTFSPTACPVPTPTGSLRFKTNQTVSQKLGGGIRLFNGTAKKQTSPFSEVQFNLSDGTLALLDSPKLFTVQTIFPDGSAVTYQAEGSKITVIDAGCTSAQEFTQTGGDDEQSHFSNPRRVEAARLVRDNTDDSDISVTISLTDMCGTPVTSAVMQLDCTPIYYIAEEAGQGPHYGEPSHSPLDNNGDGTYSGTCPITGQSKQHNHNYDTCVTEDSASLEQFCGIDLDDAKEGKKLITKLASFVKASRRYIKYVKVALQKTTAAFEFYDKACEYLQKPEVQQEFNLEDCGIQDMVAIGIENKQYSTAVTTVIATSTTVEAPIAIPTCVKGYYCLACACGATSSDQCGCVEVDHGNSDPICTQTTSCSGLQSCKSSGDCPSGTPCATSTCCGHGVCLPGSCPNSKAAAYVLGRPDQSAAQQMIFDGIYSLHKTEN